MILVIKERRVAHVWDGTAINVFNRVAALHRMGVPVMVLYDYHDEFSASLSDLGVDVIVRSFPRRSWDYLVPLRQLIFSMFIQRICARHGVHNIHVHHPYLLNFLMVPRLLGSTTVSCHIHFWFPPKKFWESRKKYSFFESAVRLRIRRSQYSLRGASKVICVSESARQFVLNELNDGNVKPNMFFVLLNAVRQDVLAVNPEPIGERKEKSIAFVGSATLEKGFPSFMQLARLLPDYSCAHFGSTKSLAQIEGLPENVYLNGFTETYFSALALNEIVVCLSEREAMPNFVLESLALGLRVVSWDIPPILDLVKLGFNIITVPHGRLDMLETAVLQAKTTVLDSQVRNDQQLASSLSNRNQALKFLDIIGVK